MFLIFLKPASVPLQILLFFFLPKIKRKKTGILKTCAYGSISSSVANPKKARVFRRTTCRPIQHPFLAFASRNIVVSLKYQSKIPNTSNCFRLFSKSFIRKPTENLSDLQCLFKRSSLVSLLFAYCFSLFSASSVFLALREGVSARVRRHKEQTNNYRSISVVWHSQFASVQCAAVVVHHQSFNLLSECRIPKKSE